MGIQDGIQLEASSTWSTWDIYGAVHGDDVPPAAGWFQDPTEISGASPLGSDCGHGADLRIVAVHQMGDGLHHAVALVILGDSNC